MASPPQSSRLAAFIERSAPAVAAAPRSAQSDEQEHCGLCGLPVPSEHRHVVDMSRRELLCACRACSVLFDHAGAGAAGRHYRLVPDRCVRIDLRLDDLAWRSLGLPVEMAFFVRDRDRGRVTAFYPSPAGATESELELDSWTRIEADNPELAELEPDVEALLVDRTNPVGTRGYLLGVDCCYRLVGVVRRHWRGFGGGDEVWQEIGRFFAGLDARAERRA